MAPFSVEEWRESVGKKINESGSWLKARWQCDLPHVVYGTLAGLALLPLVEAMAQASVSGNASFLIGAASFKLLGDLGINLTASLFERWKDKAANLDELADEAGRLAEQDPQLRQAFDQLIAQLEVIPQVQSQLSREQQRWFQATLGQETAALGSSLTKIVAGLTEIKQDTAYLPGIAANLEQLANPPNPLEMAIREYLLRLEGDCNQLTDLAALSLDIEEAAGLTLDKVYIELNTTTTIRKKDGQDGPPLPAGTAVFQDPRRMVLLGDPGSGKSVFVRHLAVGMAQNWRGIGGTLPNVTGRMSCVPLLTTIRQLGPALSGLQLKLDGLPLLERQKQLRAVLEAKWQADLIELKANELAQQLDQLLHEWPVMLILDGLDEIADSLRPLLLEAIRAIDSRYHQNIAYILLTCRVRSYPTDKKLLPDYAVHTLAPFTPEQIERFIVAWYGAVRTTADVGERIKDLQRATRTADLKPLAANPMLLTTMALIHQSRAKLPDQRVKLYKEAVEILIQRWQKTRGIEISPSLQAVLGKEKLVRTMLERLGYEAHTLLKPGQENADLIRKDILDLLAHGDYLGGEGLAAEFLAYIDHRAGLLVGRGGDEALQRPQLYSFPHRTFLEYLAGCYLISDRGVRRIKNSYLELVRDGNDWYVAAQLGAEALLHNDNRQDDFIELAFSLCSQTTPTDEAGWRATIWSAYLATRPERRAIDSFDEQEGPAYWQRLVGQLRIIIKQGLMAVGERAEAGRFLSMMGDPRPGVTFFIRNGQEIPDIAWGQTVPAGTYSISGDKEAWRSFPQQKIPIAQPYQLARYPVTYRQFQCFVEAADFGDRRWWAGMPAKDSYGPVQAISPARFPLANHPRETVSWYQAIAFCRWLSQQLGYEVDLPHEHEWEVAARYPHNWFYPWGDTFKLEKVNIDESKLEQTTAVGLFPAGANQSLDLYDLSGNVWEWCRNKYGRPTDSTIDSSGATRALRGGSWNYDRILARAAYRHYYDPDDRNSSVGWRLVRRSHL